MLVGGIMEPSKKSRILLVGDDSEDHRRFDQFLADEGFAVLCVRSGAEALRIAEQRLVELVILELDDIAVVRQCTQAYPGLPVIMLTARHDLEKAVEAFQAGAHDYIFKPVNNGYIRRIIRNALGE